MKKKEIYLVVYTGLSDCVEEHLVIYRTELEAREHFAAATTGELKLVKATILAERVASRFQ